MEQQPYTHLNRNGLFFALVRCCQSKVGLSCCLYLPFTSSTKGYSFWVGLADILDVFALAEIGADCVEQPPYTHLGRNGLFFALVRCCRSKVGLSRRLYPPFTSSTKGYSVWVGLADILDVFGLKLEQIGWSNRIHPSRAERAVF